MFGGGGTLHCWRRVCGLRDAIVIKPREHKENNVKHYFNLHTYCTATGKLRSIILNKYNTALISLKTKSESVVLFPFHHHHYYNIFMITYDITSNVR